MITLFDSGRKALFFAVSTIIIFNLSCARKQPSTEVKFTVYLTSKEDEDNKNKDSCVKKNAYLEAYALGKGNIPIQQADSVFSYTELPLDISHDSSVFVFRNEKRSDTLCLKYIRKMATEDRDLVMKISNIKVISSTFDSLKVKCKEQSQKCDDAESVTIYY